MKVKKFCRFSIQIDTPKAYPNFHFSTFTFHLYQKQIAFWCAILIAALVTSCASPPPTRPEPGFEQTGLASYYAKKFHGRRTASGERYDRNAMTAAHRYLPFGTVVTVRNTKNNRSVQVRINDRGPYIKGRIIDLSYAAARKLGMIKNGVAAVQIVISPQGP